MAAQFEGTLDQFSSDAMNEPSPLPRPAERGQDGSGDAEATGGLTSGAGRGRELGFDAGIAQGYAKSCQIGFTDRSGYTATGTVCNLAAHRPRRTDAGCPAVAVAIEETAVLDGLRGQPRQTASRDRPLLSRV